MCVLYVTYVMCCMCAFVVCMCLCVACKCTIWWHWFWHHSTNCTEAAHNRFILPPRQVKTPFKVAHTTFKVSLEWAYFRRKEMHTSFLKLCCCKGFPQIPLRTIKFLFLLLNDDKFCIEQNIRHCQFWILFCWSLQPQTDLFKA